jgi:predicted TIM-barrel fold metal-dependent hydrolase
MQTTRRETLTALLSASLGMAGGCCMRQYPGAAAPVLPFGATLPGGLAPARSAITVPGRTPIIDVHAHFFNAADVPVRGFVEECLGHNAPPAARALLRAAARIAERLAKAAPTAEDEMKQLPELAALTLATVQGRVPSARQSTAQDAAAAIRGSEFERRYRAMTRRSGSHAGPARSGPLSRDEILEVVTQAEDAAATGPQASVSIDPRTPDAIVADNVLAFLVYFLSPRWVNLQSYMKVFTTGQDAFGIDMVFGALVDFDYWLDCPPRSSHDAQVRLHQHLAELYSRDPEGRPNRYFRPVVAYNPWTDIKQGGAGLRRVVDACTKGDFVAVKIYPPTGFRPFGNETIPSGTGKSRPNLKELDTTLCRFFATCADARIPVLAHSAFSNGRDGDHDDFGGPAGWKALLARCASTSKAQVVDFGHFGGSHAEWTQEFADLMRDQPRMLLYGDIGYWEELMCASGLDTDPCRSARARLQKAMRTAIPGGNETVLDRVMFATDWLFLSRVDKWAQYPQRVHDALRSIPGMDAVGLAKVFGGNAKKCFNV